MTLWMLVLRYVGFAVIATIANLLTQRGFLAFGETNVVFAMAVFAGTLIGLVVKYYLDKRWIFDDPSAGAKAQSTQFLRYTAMGIVTTAIFWATETVFWWMWKTDVMRELGAVLGLSVGYFIKYRLDRRFVFTNARAGQVG
jgi:putative flippase GtrA